VEESEANCTATGLTPGIHQVVASYSGATFYEPSLGSLEVEVLGPTSALRPKFTG
jgi:hypothetical protein